MSTTKAARSLQEIASSLSTEMRYYSQDTSVFNGATVVTCFRNIVCVDMGMSIIDLPTPIWNIFHDADSNRSNTYEALELAKKIDAIGAGVV